METKALGQIRRQLSETLENAYALAYALARMEGALDPLDLHRSVRDQFNAYLSSLDIPDVSNVVNLDVARPQHEAPPVRLRPSAAPRSQADRRSVQELLLEAMQEGEVTLPDLLAVLDDAGHSVTPGHLSVMLSRMTQAGLIDRSGRGRYIVHKRG
jgi:hypothetical protein